MIDLNDANEILNKNYQFIKKLSMYIEITPNIKIKIKRNDKRAWDEMIEAETKRNTIIIYKDVIEFKNFPYKDREELEQIIIISHEFWHIFAARFKFYNKLEKIFTEQSPPINKLEKSIIEKFLIYLNEMSIKKIDVLLTIYSMYGRWNKKYLYELAKYNSKKPFLARIKGFNFELRGLIGEMFAEAYASLLLGINTSFVDKQCIIVLKNLFGLK
jgi:hypothetical protein